jgi:hypothetical protein
VGIEPDTIPDSQSGALPLELQPPSKHLRPLIFTRRAGIEPAVAGFGNQHPAIGTYGVTIMRREGFEPPMTVRSSGLRPDALPLCHLRETNSQRGRIRTFEDRAPEARALPNYATRCAREEMGDS